MEMYTIYNPACGRGFIMQMSKILYKFEYFFLFNEIFESHGQNGLLAVLRLAST